MPTKLYLIRHGETEWNKEAKYQGHTDTVLSEKGREQAECLALRMENFNIDALYSSDLKRAYETAQFIGQQNKLEITTSNLLRELNFGDWEGLTFNEIQESYGELVEEWYSNPSKVQIPNGETFLQLKERTTKIMDEIISNNKEKSIAIVSHGGTIRTIICSLIDLNLDKMWNFRQGNTAINLIEIYDKVSVIGFLNDCNHLD